MKQDPTFSKYAEAPDLQAYEGKPVESFGMSMLQSMGFTPQRGIGHNKKNALNDLLILKPRPRGLGLGAEQENQEKRAKFEIGALVVITKGAHEGLIGRVTEVKESDMMVELTKSSSVVKVALNDVKSITKQQARQKQAKEGKEQGKKKKRLKWIVPNIRVKIIDKQSKYYLKKVIVNEVLSQSEFQCIFKDEQGQQRFIKDLREKDVQTVVPKQGGEVLIVKGSHIGEKGKILKLDKKSEQVIVQTDSQLELITVGEDDLSEYVEY